jgi:hypothetical protein
MHQGNIRCRNQTKIPPSHEILQDSRIASIHGVHFPFAANDAPRERLLMDFGWRFYMGDAPDAGNLFDYPEFKRLDKTRPDDDAREAANAPLRVDAAKANLGHDASFVSAFLYLNVQRFRNQATRLDGLMVHHQFRRSCATGQAKCG